jgi:hypothetical protein
MRAALVVVMRLQGNTRQQYVAFFTLMEPIELTLSLGEKARRKALAKTRRLMQNDPATAPSPDAS